MVVFTVNVTFSDHHQAVLASYVNLTDSDGKWLTVFVEHLSSITVQLQQLVPEDRQQKEVVSYYKAT